MRAYPMPPAARTLHVLSDTHIHPGFVYEARRQFVLDDLAHPSVPQVDYHAIAGDVTNTATVEQFDIARTFMAALGGECYAAVGNHDCWARGDGTGTQPHRPPADAATDLGMPATSFTVDMGFAMLVVPLLTSSSLTHPVEWLNGTLQAAGKHCIIVSHGSLKDTAGYGEPETEQWRTTELGWYASGAAFGVTADLDQCLADNPNAKAWIGGHTHSSLNVNRLVWPVARGGHTIAAVNSMAIAYTGKTAEWHDRIASLYLTVEDDRIDVRFRDHGAHAWVGGSSEYRRCWSVNL